MSILVKPMRYEEMSDFLASRKTEAIGLYEKTTARKLAAHYGILYNSNWQKACFRILGDKGLGLGGSRNYKKPVGSKRKPLSEKKTTIILGLSPEAIKILNNINIGDTHSRFIERLIIESQTKP